MWQKLAKIAKIAKTFDEEDVPQCEAENVFTLFCMLFCWFLDLL